MNRLLLVMVAASFLSSCQGQTANPGKAEKIALIELFTSEGCSSCPPADKLLAKYSMDSVYNGARIFALSFHVDYWNNLGWRDSFSSGKYSDRQRMYAQTFDLSSVYTPQMIVNGNKQFVGSDEDALKEALSAIPYEKSKARFAKVEVVKDALGYKAHYELQGDIKGCEVHFVVISDHVSTNVKRGENSGKRLSHTNVVRKFITSAANVSGDIGLGELPEEAGNTSIIVYLQRTKDLHIITAAKANLFY